MGCVGCSKVCEEDDHSLDTKSFDSIRSSCSDNQFHRILASSLEGLYPVEEPRPPRKATFEKAKFACSVVVYYNNSKQNPRLNPYSQSVEKNPEMYFRFFPNLQGDGGTDAFAVERGGSYDAGNNKECIDILQRSDAFQKHLRITHKLFNSILGIAVNEDISSTATTLKRIGAKHAELGIHAKHVHAFHESFLKCLEQSLDTDKDVFETWDVLIKYVVNMIVIGMNDYYKKVIFVLWNVRPQRPCVCPLANSPQKPGTIDPEALLSLKNMATTLAAQLD